MKWRFSAPAGDVEGSKLYLFSVIMPAKCVSSVSPRFHYRRVAFCFLPLAVILEFLRIDILKGHSGYCVRTEWEARDRSDEPEGHCKGQMRNDGARHEGGRGNTEI
jgi:hypothetical protein